jgi:hypothetical protein
MVIKYTVSTVGLDGKPVVTKGKRVLRPGESATLEVSYPKPASPEPPKAP